MFSKHTFGAKHYGHRSPGYREPGIYAPPMGAGKWKRFLEQMKREKELRARVLVAKGPVITR